METLKSWVEVPDNSDFSIYNIPFGIFQRADQAPRIGTAIGDKVVDLDYLQKSGYVDIEGVPQGMFIDKTLNNFIALGRKKTGEVRQRLIELLDENTDDLQYTTEDVELALIPMSKVKMLMPVDVPNYTDFYSSQEHATNVGTMFRDPANALFPNWKHLPVAYHGRPSSIIPSGVAIHRPKGQTKPPEADVPVFGPTKRLDFELEMAFITCSNTELGQSIPVASAENHIFGMVLFNDWSARDVQVWEYVPLGPFLAKNFASSISPWIVTMDALEAFKVDGPKQEVKVLPYLASEGKKSFDINLSVAVQPEGVEEKVVCNSNYKYMYWNICQQLAHHTINGCNIEVGDMYGSGTISGSTPDSYGSMLELAWKGTKPLKMSDGSERKFIDDGDTVIMRGFAEKDGKRVGFGEVKTKVLPAI